MTIDERITEAAEDVRRSLMVVEPPPITGLERPRTNIATILTGPRGGWRTAVAAAALVLVAAAIPIALRSVVGEPANTASPHESAPSTTAAAPDRAGSQGSVALTPVPLSDDLRKSRFSSVATDGSRFIAGGAEFEFTGGEFAETRPAVWLSSDGTTWERVDSPAFETTDRAEPFNDTFVTDVAIGPLGMVAVGAEGRSSSDDYDAVAWFSPDGTDWVRLTSTIEGHAGAGPQLLQHVVAGGSGWVAAGHLVGPTGDKAGIWTSRDGIDWTLAQLPVSNPSFDVTGLVAGHGAVVAVGHAPGSPARVPYYDGWFDVASVFDFEPLVWRTTDGTAWEQISLQAADGQSQEVGAFVESVALAPDGTFMAIGRRVMRGESYFDRNTEVVTWSSSDGVDWTLTPSVVRGIPYDSRPEFALMQPTRPVLVADGTRLRMVANCRPSDAASDQVEWGCVFGSEDGGASWSLITSTTPTLWHPDDSTTEVPELSALLVGSAQSFVDAVFTPDGRLVVAGITVWIEDPVG